MANVAVDTNLLLLLIVGRVDRSFIPHHKRLKAFSPTDYDLLMECIEGAEAVLTTPNALSETLNLLVQGLREPLLSACRATFVALVGAMNESYVESRRAATCQEFNRLGLTDCAWLECLDAETLFLTTDLDLFIAATARGKAVANFTHLREDRGL